MGSGLPPLWEAIVTFQFHLLPKSPDLASLPVFWIFFHSTLYLYQEGSVSLLSFCLLQQFWV